MTANLRQRQRFHRISKIVRLRTAVRVEFIFTLIGIFHLYFPQLLIQPSIFSLYISILFLSQPMFSTALFMRVEMYILFVKWCIIARFSFRDFVLNQRTLVLFDERRQRVSNAVTAVTWSHNIIVKTDSRDNYDSIEKLKILGTYNIRPGQ